MLAQLAAIWILLIPGVLLLVYFGFVARSWWRLAKPRPAYRTWHLGAAAAALLVLGGWVAFDLLSANPRPDQGIETYVLIPVQVFLAAGLLARVRWNLYPVAVLAGLTAIFTGAPAVLSPTTEPMEFVAAATGIVDAAVLLAAIQLLRRQRQEVRTTSSPRIA